MHFIQLDWNVFGFVFSKKKRCFAMFSADDAKQSHRKSTFEFMVKLKNSSNTEMCFAVALSQTYLELLSLLAYPTSIGSDPERELLYTLQSTVCFVGGREQTRWV